MINPNNYHNNITINKIKTMVDICRKFVTDKETIGCCTVYALTGIGWILVMVLIGLLVETVF